MRRIFRELGIEGVNHRRFVFDEVTMVLSVPRVLHSEFATLHRERGRSRSERRPGRYIPTTARNAAVRLDRERLAEMSCIAGVGEDVGPLVDTATSGRSMLVIDGCPLECVRKCLE